MKVIRATKPYSADELAKLSPQKRLLLIIVNLCGGAMGEDNAIALCDRLVDQFGDAESALEAHQRGLWGVTPEESTLSKIGPKLVPGK